MHGKASQEKNATVWWCQWLTSFMQLLQAWPKKLNIKHYLLIFTLKLWELCSLPPKVACYKLFNMHKLINILTNYFLSITKMQVEFFIHHLDSSSHPNTVVCCQCRCVQYCSAQDNMWCTPCKGALQGIQSLHTKITMKIFTFHSNYINEL